MEEIDLGFAEECDDVAWLTNRYFPSKLGGKPAWLELESLPQPEQLLCANCKLPKSFLCQLYAPFDDAYNFHRSIYIFVCRNLNCQESNKSGNITVLRSQLPRKNNFYSELEPEEKGNPLPAIPCLRKLCKVCGCQAPRMCSRCKSVNYCSTAHQRAHWPQHKIYCNSGTSGDNEFLSDIQFPEYEIMMEKNPTKIQSNEDGKDENEQMAEFEKLAAEGKTGELSNLSEAELDKYFAETADVDDKTFRHFKKETANESEQIIRYNREGEPLWITDVAKTVQDQLLSVPKCSHCGGQRQFEFQIMPQMLVFLKDEHLDWGVLSVYTCAKSCEISGYVEEFVIKQDIVMEKMS